MRRLRLLRCAVAVLAACTAAGPAAAQDVPDTGGRVFGAIGGVGGDGDSTVLGSVGAGIRVTKHLGVDFEVLHADDLGLPTDIDVVIQTLAASFAPVERVERSRLTTFVTRMTVEFPMRQRRVWPYVTWGGGVSSLRQTVSFRNLPLPLSFPVDGSPSPAIFPGPEINVASTDLTLTIGGGVDVRLWRGFAVGGNVRYLTLLGKTDRYDFAVVSSRVSYRF